MWSVSSARSDVSVSVDLRGQRGDAQVWSEIICRLTSDSVYCEKAALAGRAAAAVRRMW